MSLDVLRDGARWQLEHGDCLDVLRRLPTERIDAIVTDPPYGISYRPRSKKRAAIINDGRPFIWWLCDAYRVVNDGGALVCFCRWDVQEAFKFAIEIAGFSVKAQLVWDHERHGMGDTTGSFAPRHDVMWFATKGRFRLPGKRPDTVLRAARPSWQHAVHPTEKPVPLMRDLVRAVCLKGGVVLDPFAGSGATGVACIEEGRRFVGVELDAKYIEVATRRLASAEPSDASAPAA